MKASVLRGWVVAAAAVVLAAGACSERSGISVVADAAAGSEGHAGAGGAGGRGGSGAGGSSTGGGGSAEGGSGTPGQGGTPVMAPTGPLGAGCLIPPPPGSPAGDVTTLALTTAAADTGSSGAPPPPPPQTSPPLPVDLAGPWPLRPLSRLEYGNTVHDLLGAVPDVTATLPEDEGTWQFPYTRGSFVTTPGALALMNAAEVIADSAAEHLDDFLPSCCRGTPAAADMQKACAQQFITQFGWRAFRRPLRAEEVDDLTKLYEQQRAPGLDADFRGAIRAVIAAMLQAPQFLYLGGPGQSDVLEGNMVRLDNFQMASRLSYFLTASMPDPALLLAAQNGTLIREDGIAEQFERLWKTPAAAAVIEDFHVQWLGLGQVVDAQKDAPGFTPALARSMLAESKRFARAVVQEKKGGLEDLLTASWSYVDGPLAKLYGLPAPAGSELGMQALDPKQRSGILTQGAFLAGHADAKYSRPVLRGMEIVQRLTCLEIPPEPPGVPPPGPRRPGQTTRQSVIEAIANPACQACHQILDPPGFAFENYDAVGAYRTTEEGQAVDASGQMDIGGRVVTFANAIELTHILAKENDVQDCLVAQWFRYALRRQELDTERYSLDRAKDAYQGGNSVHDLLWALVRTRAFRYRAAVQGETK